MTNEMYEQIKKALGYALDGDPMKDAFMGKIDEGTAIIAAFEFVVENYKPKGPK